ncbi:hypothetical protein Tco_1153398 [Tanacetum coccineum]
MEECHRRHTSKIDLVNPEGHRVIPDVSKPLPLGGPPGQVTIQPHYFFNRDLEYLVSGDKERRNALSISILKTAYYLDFRLEELVLLQWIESEHEYDISAAYELTTMSTRSRKLTLKNLHLNDFENLYLLHLQRKFNYLPGSDKVYLFNAVNMWIRNIVIKQRVEDLQLGIESYQTKLNLIQPSWDALDFLFKEDYTIVSKLKAFSDGTLKRVLEKLDHMVKDFKLFKYNPGMEDRIWSEDEKRRNEEFIEVIERRLKIRRIFRNLESFVSGRFRDINYRLISRTK